MAFCHLLVTFGATFVWINVCLSQTVTPPSSTLILSCANRVASTMTACDNFYDTLVNCNDTTTTEEDFKACYCAQPVLNAIYDCESEQEQCLETHDLNQGVEKILDEWDSICDTFISFTPTTPVEPGLSKTYSIPFCTTAASSCALLEETVSQCATLPAESAMSSCLCQSELLSQAYTCGYLGNVSCLQIPGTSSVLPGYDYCSDYPKSFANPVDASATTTFNFTSSASSPSSSGSSRTSSSGTKPHSSSSSSVPTATSTSSSSADGIRRTAPYVLFTPRDCLIFGMWFFLAAVGCLVLI